MTKSDLIDLTLIVLHETPAAILVSETGSRKDAVWLPKSQVEFAKVDEAANAITGLGAHVVTLPEWLAIKTGLV